MAARFGPKAGKVDAAGRSGVDVKRT